MPTEKLIQMNVYVRKRIRLLLKRLARKRRVSMGRVVEELIERETNGN